MKFELWLKRRKRQPEGRKWDPKINRVFKQNVEGINYGVKSSKDTGNKWKDLGNAITKAAGAVVDKK